MTAEHILQDCRIHQREREKIWPSPVALGTKLYGTLEELRATAAFIVDIGVDIYSGNCLIRISRDKVLNSDKAIFRIKQC